MNLDLITESVKELAIETGSFIKKERLHFENDKVEKKGAHDYVSYVDKESESKLVDGLSKILPDAAFLTEEGTGITSNLSSDIEWVIDPLDGTTNFIHNNAPFNVSIALRQRTDKKLLVGVVYECCRNELFWANAESYSYLNGRCIKVSKTNTLDDSFIGLGFPYNAEECKPQVLSYIERLYGNVSGLRVMGSAACELCYVACGRFDGRIESRLKPWDISAGALILQRAGGRLSDFSGGEDWKEGVEVLATNGHIHEELVQRISES